MDYLDMVMKGYSNPNTRGFLVDYIVREYKKAMKDHYSKEEFFSGCLNVYKLFNEDISRRFFERKNELYMIMSAAAAGRVKYPEPSTSEDSTDQKIQLIDNCKQELSDLSEQNFYVHLHSVTKGRYTGHLSQKEVQLIGVSIAQAFDNVSTKRFDSFSAMFDEACLMGALGDDLKASVTSKDFTKKQAYQISEQYYQTLFKDWLETKKGWGVGNETLYETFLTKEIFLEFLEYVAIQERLRGEALSKERESWNTKSPIQVEGKSEKNIGFAPKPFNELFNNPALMNDCINLLREMDKPCIGDSNNYIGNTKGVLIVWLRALETKGFLSCSFANDKERAAILNHNFHSLDISASLFGQGNKRAKEYKTYFETELTAIKGGNKL